jgi:hypothetical protein
MVKRRRLFYTLVAKLSPEPGIVQDEVEVATADERVELGMLEDDATTVTTAGPNDLMRYLVCHMPSS